MTTSPVRTIQKQTGAGRVAARQTVHNTGAVRTGVKAKETADKPDVVKTSGKVTEKKPDKSEKIRRIVTLVSGLVGAACLGYFAFYCISAANARKQAETLAGLKEVTAPVIRQKPATVTLDLVEEPPEVLEEYQTLYIKNKSLAGWIRIPDTEIDYPVMQTRNNDYYLTHDFEQNEDKNGSIFLDCDCSIWPRSENLLIYGHNMMSGKMFGTLDNYKSEDYFKKHPAIQFDTLYERGTYQIMYVFSEVVHEASEVTFKYYQFIDANSAEEYDSNMRYMAEMSLYDTGVTSSFGDDLITLSTCDYEEGSERFAVVAKKIN